MRTIPDRVEDAIIRADLIIEYYKEDKSYEIFRYNSYLLPEYKKFINKLASSFKNYLESAIQVHKDDPADVIQDLLLKIDNLHSYFTINNETIDHTNLQVTYHDHVAETCEIIEPSHYKSKIKPFLKFQHSLVDEIIVFLNRERLKNLKANKVDVKILEKIKWKGTPSQFASLFKKLQGQGWIDYPIRKGVPTSKKFAENCFRVFEIDAELSTLIKEFGKDNSFDRKNADAFKIPNIKDYS